MNYYNPLHLQQFDSFCTLTDFIGVSGFPLHWSPIHGLTVQQGHQRQIFLKYVEFICGRITTPVHPLTYGPRDALGVLVRSTKELNNWVWNLQSCCGYICTTRAICIYLFITQAYPGTRLMGEVWGGFVRNPISLRNWHATIRYKILKISGEGKISSTSALIVLSHNDRGVRALIMGCPMGLKRKRSTNFSARPVPSQSNRAVKSLGQTAAPGERLWESLLIY